MPRKAKATSMVVIVRTPDNWRPERVQHMPPVFTDGRVLAKNLAWGEAEVMAAKHNVTRLYPNTHDGNWAMVVSSLLGWKERQYRRLLFDMKRQDQKTAELEKEFADRLPPAPNMEDPDYA